MRWQIKVTLELEMGVWRLPILQADITRRPRCTPSGTSPGRCSPREGNELLTPPQVQQAGIPDGTSPLVRLHGGKKVREGNLLIGGVVRMFSPRDEIIAELEQKRRTHLIST